MEHRGTYLIVVPVPTYPLGEDRFAVESAFCEELRTVSPLIEQWVSHIVLATRRMSEADYQRNKASLAVMTLEGDRVEAVPLFPAAAGKIELATRWITPVVQRLWREVERAAIVHSGPSHDLWRPFEMGALVMGRLQGCKTLSVTDMDLRGDARMAYETGRISLLEYAKNRLVYDPVRDLQHVAIVRMCDLVLFKGQALCRDFGRGRPHVKNIFDPAFPPELVASDRRVEAKLSQLRDPAEPLKLLYFGRFTPYKGIPVMLDALLDALPRVDGRVELLLMGAGEQEQELRQRVEREGLSEVVTFGTPVPYGAEFFEHLYDHHLMLATPLGEDSPRSSWDALAAGVPLLAFDTYHYRSLEPTGAVDLVPWPSTAAVAERIVHYARHREALVEPSWAAVRAARENTQLTWLHRRIDWIATLLGEAPPDAVQPLSLAAQ